MSARPLSTAHVDLVFAEGADAWRSASLKKRRFVAESSQHRWRMSKRVIAFLTLNGDEMGRRPRWYDEDDDEDPPEPDPAPEVKPQQIEPDPPIPVWIFDTLL